MRPAFRLVSGLVALAAGVLACGSDPQSPEAVIARVGSAARPAESQPALRATARKLDVLTRNALPGDQPFRVRVPANARRVDWSQAVVERQGEAGGVDFEVALKLGDGEWAPLRTGATVAGSGWHDHTLELPAAHEPRSLRFSTGLSGSTGPEALWGSVRFVGPTGDPPARPNVVLISLDTLGAAYLGAFSGRPGVSPEIDRFLASAASFERAYAQYGNTLVSHASLFSALHPKHHGVYPGELPVALPSSLVETLAAAGYRTAAFTEGAFVSAAFGFARGFDSYDDGAVGLTRQMAGGAAATFDRAGTWVETDRGPQRFFLFLHTYEVHSPYLPRNDAALRVAAELTPGDERVPPRELQARQLLLHNSGQEPLPARDLARLAALHIGEVHGLDAVVGRFLARLDAAGLVRDTLVVITSDHGDQFGEADKVGHGDSLHGRVLHVPLGFRWPGVIAPRRLESPVQLIDVMPTLLELLELPVPAALDGISHAAALTGDGPLAERPAFAEQRSGRGECARLGLELGCRLDRLAVYSGSWKLVTSKLPAWRRLYDLSRDPLEERDVADEQPEALARMSALAHAYGNGNAARTPRDRASDLDADTLNRLRDLGYAVPGDLP